MVYQEIYYNEKKREVMANIEITIKKIADILEQIADRLDNLEERINRLEKWRYGSLRDE